MQRIVKAERAARIASAPIMRRGLITAAIIFLSSHDVVVQRYYFKSTLHVWRMPYGHWILIFSNRRSTRR